MHSSDSRPTDVQRLGSSLRLARPGLDDRTSSEMKFAKPTHSRKSVQLHSAEPDITAALLKDSQEISPSKPKTRRSQNDYSNDDSDESKSNEFSLRFLIMIRHFTILPVGIFNHVAELEAIVHLVHWTSHRRWPLVVWYSMFAALFGTSMATPIAPLTAAVAQPQHLTPVQSQRQC